MTNCDYIVTKVHLRRHQDPINILHRDNGSKAILSPSAGHKSLAMCHLPHATRFKNPPTMTNDYFQVCIHIVGKINLRVTGIDGYGAINTCGLAIDYKVKVTGPRGHLLSTRMAFQKLWNTEDIWMNGYTFGKYRYEDNEYVGHAYVGHAWYSWWPAYHWIWRNNTRKQVLPQKRITIWFTILKFPPLLNAKRSLVK